jgi:iron complex outermembrane receptor protein
VRTDNLFSSYLQDDLTLVPEYLHLIVGTKLEHNDYTGFEVQPGVRLLWTPDKRQTVWGSVARAVRTPSRIEADGRINSQTFPPNAAFPGSPLTLAALFGDHDFVSEELTAYEVGYRVSATERLSLDFAGFFNDYDHLRTLAPGTPFLEFFPPPVHLTDPAFAANQLHGQTFGLEVAGNWKVTDYWKVNAGYSWLQMNLTPEPGSQDVTPPAGEGKGPHNQFHVRSFLDLPGHLELDTALYYVDNLPQQGIPRYVRLDIRLGWRPRENVELVLGAQNLLEPRHLEFGPSSFIQTLPTPAERNVYGLVRWHF